MAAATLFLLAACNNDGTADAKKDSSSTTEKMTTDNTRTTTNVEIPATTRTTFETKYPQATNVTWRYYDPNGVPIDWAWSGWPSLDTGDYMASFNMDGGNYWVWYDDQGQWVGTVTTVQPSSLPAAVTATINSQFPGATIVSVDKENDKNRTAYEIDLENGSDKMTLLIDENGKVMKKKGTIGGTKTKEKPIKDSTK